MYLEFNKNNGNLLKQVDNQYVIAHFGLKISFFNPYVNCWEPLLENSGLSIEYLDKEDESRITIQTSNEFPIIDFNISDNLIKLLKETAALWSIDK